MSVLGIDYGERFIGLALGDAEVGVATPLEVIQNTDATLEYLQKFVDTEGVELIVVGIPLPTSREQNNSAQLTRTKEFISALEKQTSIPIVVEDEGFTSAESARLQEETGVKQKDDALAAMLILQQYFNRSEQ